MSSTRTSRPTGRRSLFAALGALLVLAALLTTSLISAGEASARTTASSTSSSTTTSSRTLTTSSTSSRTRRTHHRRAPRGRRIIRVARRWVGTRYTWGGTSPRTGFDCSGYTRFVFNHADIRHLPHQSERQRHAYKMHRIRRRNARAGDLIFYMSHGDAYHVAIFDGHGGQYSAVDPQQGVRHQKIHARNIQFRTDWHR